MRGFSVVGWLCVASASFLPPTSHATIIFDFEQLADLAPWRLNAARIERVAAHARHGEHALHLVLLPGQYPGLAMDDRTILAGWRDHDFLRFEIWNPTARLIPLTLRLDDRQSRDYGSRYNVEQRLRPGWNHLEIPLRRLQTSNRARLLDPAELRRFMLFSSDVTEPVDLYLDHVRLESTAAVAGQTAVRAFDFGPAGSPVGSGFEPVTPAQVASAHPVMGFDDELPDAICRDFISGPPEHRFRNRWSVAVSNDTYRVIVCGQSLLNEWAHFPARSYRVLANDVPKVEVVINAENFFTPDYLFRGLQQNWWPGKDVWGEEILPKFRQHSFEMVVTNQMLELTFDTLAVYWVAICPARQGAALESWLNRLHTQRREEFYERYFYLEPYQPPPRPTAIGLRAARGQTVSAFFAMAESPSAPRFPAESGITARLRAVRLIERPIGPGVYRIARTALVEPASLPHPTEYGVTISVAANARPGRYQSRVGDVPIEVDVWPFALPATTELPMTYGWYYAPPTGLNYHYTLFPETAGIAAVRLREELRDMAEHGFNSVTVPGPRPLANGQLDTSGTEQFLATAREEGLLRRHRGLMSVWSIANWVGRYYEATEFSEAFLNPFNELLRRLGVWLRREEQPVLAYVIDEPREQAPHPWNRNFADTKQFLELYRHHEIPTAVTLMSDESFGRDYTPLVPLLTVVSTHPWTKSRGIYAAARAAGVDLWLYNGGMDRLSWGFYPWAVGARGRWEWHYQWWGQAWDPFAHGSDGPWSPGFGAVMPSPGGPLATVGYEQIRAGIDDYRYVCRLEELIRAHPEGGRAARAFLEQLRQEVPQFMDERSVREEQLDAWRERLADLIVELQ